MRAPSLTAILSATLLSMVALWFSPDSSDESSSRVAHTPVKRPATGSPLSPPPAVDLALGTLTTDRVHHTIELPTVLPPGSWFQLRIGPSFRVLAEDALESLHSGVEVSRRNRGGESRSLAQTCYNLSGLVTDPMALAGDAPRAGQALELGHRVLEMRRRQEGWGGKTTALPCLTALVDLSRAYERENPDAALSVRLAGEILGRTRFQMARGASTVFVKPIEPHLSGRRLALEVTKKGPGRLVYILRLHLGPRMARVASNPT